MIAVSTVLIFVLLCVAGIMVALITMSSMTNEMTQQSEKLRNYKSLVTSNNTTIGGNSQLVANSTNAQIAGVLNHPTVVDLTPQSIFNKCLIPLPQNCRDAGVIDKTRP